MRITVDIIRVRRDTISIIGFSYIHSLETGGFAYGLDDDKAQEFANALNKKRGKEVFIVRVARSADDRDFGKRCCENAFDVLEENGKPIGYLLRDHAESLELLTLANGLSLDERRHAMADMVYMKADFIADLRVEDTDGWEWSSGGNEFSRTLFCENTDNPDGPTVSKRLTITFKLESEDVDTVSVDGNLVRYP